MQQISDLRDEAREFDRLLAVLKDVDWQRATQFKAWTPNDIVRHLHAGDLLALASARDPVSFDKMFADGQAKRQAGLSRRDIERERIGTEVAGAALRERWRTTLAELCDALAAKPADARLKWAGPDMGLRMFTTARQMEVWAHAQAIYDLIGLERPAASARLRNIVEIGVRTFGWTYRIRSLTIPPNVPRIRLDGPNGETWQWNEGNTSDRVSGDAVAFCQVVTQTRNVADTALTVEGDVARQWMGIAQCFAGPPETPPAKGTRYRAATTS